MIPITITTKALEEIKKIMQFKNIPNDYGLPLGMKGSGCAGTFLLRFDKKKRGDKIYNIDGLEILIEKKQLMYLVNLELDYCKGSDAKGFMFNSQP